MSTLDDAVAPLNLARRGALRLATRSPLVTRALARRDVRLAVVGTAQVALYLALSIAAPVALFAVAPVFLGVAHVASDVRYLVLRRRLPRSVLALSAAAASALLAVRVLSMLRVVHLRVAPWELAIGAAWIVLAFACGARARGAASRGRAAVGAVGLALLIAAGASHPREAYLVFFHAHNVVAVAVWLLVFRRDRRWALWPVGAVAVGLAMIFSGALLPWTNAAHGAEAFGLDLAQLGRWLAPGLPFPLAASVVVSFVFLQGVHYAAWLGWIPQDSLPGEGTLTFRMSARSLVRDFGAPGTAIVALLAAALLATACFRLHQARDTYMALSNFHGWLECAVLAYLLVRGEGAKQASER